jgi:hypothetical protein
MTLAIPLSPDAEARLKERASRAGVDATTYAAQILEQKLREPLSLADISGDSAKRFAESGLTEEQLAAQLEREDHAARGVRYDE